MDNLFNDGPPCARKMTKRLATLKRLYARCGLEYWRWRMVQTPDQNLRLRYSQACDRWLTRYYRALPVHGGACAVARTAEVASPAQTLVRG